MRVSATKTAPRVERDVYITSKGIKGYGRDNDYPQKVLEIINSSGTGRLCMDIYVKFVEGAGFTDLTLSETVVNSTGERTNSLRRKFSKDLKSFNGFACLVKYNFQALPSEYFNIPFEQCRLEIKSSGDYTGRVAVHPDWTGQMGRFFNNRDIKYFDKFDPSKVMDQMIEAGGPENYPGQIMYFTADGDWEYPISPFDPIITDMLTEESCSTIKYRNAKNNFLPAGILVRKGIKPRTLPDGSKDPHDPYNREQEESLANIKKMQGDQNALKLWIIDIDSDEEMPELIPFDITNLDKEYDYTEKSVQQNIASMFLIPPVLRGIAATNSLGGGFGADVITNAYNFMNSITSNERLMIETAFKDLFQMYQVKFAEYTIKPLTYITNEQTPIKISNYKRLNVINGGEGSGNFDHEGRPGEVGGSGSGGGGIRGKQIEPKYIDNDYDLSKDNINDAVYDIKSGLDFGIMKDYKYIGDSVIRIKNHTPEWLNFADDIENKGIKNIYNFTIGNYYNKNYEFNNKTELSQMQSKYPNVNFYDDYIEDGTSVNSAIKSISRIINGR